MSTHSLTNIETEMQRQGRKVGRPSWSWNISIQGFMKFQTCFYVQSDKETRSIPLVTNRTLPILTYKSQKGSTWLCSNPGEHMEQGVECIPSVQVSWNTAAQSTEHLVSNKACAVGLLSQLCYLPTNKNKGGREGGRKGSGGGGRRRDSKKGCFSVRLKQLVWA